MRLAVEITELDEARWAYLQRQVRTEYQIGAHETRVCLTFAREGEERHIEMPMGILVGLLIGIGTVGLGDTIRTAMAALTPDALPDFLKKTREAADSARGATAEQTEEVDK